MRSSLEWLLQRHPDVTLDMPQPIPSLGEEDKETLALDEVRKTIPGWVSKFESQSRCLSRIHETGRLIEIVFTFGTAVGRIRGSDV
jgi:hypothetical protein